MSNHVWCATVAAWLMSALVCFAGLVLAFLTARLHLEDDAAAISYLSNAIIALSGGAVKVVYVYRLCTPSYIFHQ